MTEFESILQVGLRDQYLVFVIESGDTNNPSLVACIAVPSLVPFHTFRRLQNIAVFATNYTIARVKHQFPHLSGHNINHHYYLPCRPARQMSSRPNLRRKPSQPAAPRAIVANCRAKPPSRKCPRKSRTLTTSTKIVPRRTMSPRHPSAAVAVASRINLCRGSGSSNSPNNRCCNNNSSSSNKCSNSKAVEAAAVTR
ncbi:uncharacterized protein BCR38DRAFT_479063 [Pseudomassariella vexata]|uniref:Uncharacterized protein n=1 Tax=Pseudomassariella vexata TaxID=1141098 RepID=A0A1Y2D8U8_9PEZI|nr:uncharacterized protein BCR38DRAFT_479063 [Pseudomassariella vexata]ORY55692.1 hypothetical protein BCR38DRAFT_479063 [Pseudomassariella vexata]